jgi:Tfp pilus assembly protein PilO
MSEYRGVLYKTRWEILVMAAVLIIAAVVVVGLPHNFTAKMLQEQKAQKAAEQGKNLETTLKEQVGFSEGTQGNATATNLTGTKP